MVYFYKTSNKLVSFLRATLLIGVIQSFDGEFLKKIVKQNPNKKEDAFLTVEVNGTIGGIEKVKILSLSTFSDYDTTAVVTAIFAKSADLNRVKGVVNPFEIISLNDVLLSINKHKITVDEFEI